MNDNESISTEDMYYCYDAEFGKIVNAMYCYGIVME